MATLTKLPLSESDFGKQILVTGTGLSELTTLHSGVSGAGANVTGEMDEIYLYAYNSHSGDIELTVMWGGTGDADEMKTTIPYQAGRYLIVDGKLGMSGIQIEAFAGTGTTETGKINIDGYVNRIQY